jgi:phthiodiolone/phenolphthiodiolone dimycocerosates ketoreductase
VAAQRRTPHEQLDFAVLLGHLAARAGRVRLGVGVTDPIRRHPVVLAQTMITLAHLTRRAPVLGIGAGERMNIDPYGLDFTHPVDRLEEALQVLRACLTSRDPIDFQGRHYRLDRALLVATAPRGRTPQVWVAAHGPRMLELAGRYGDGWFPTLLTDPDEYATKLSTVRDAARRAGRGTDAVLPALQCFVVVAPTREQARAMLRTRALRMVALGFPAERWRRLGAAHPLGDGFRGYVDLLPEAYDRATVEAALSAVPAELVERGPLLWGTPHDVAERLGELGEVGLRHVVLAPLSALVSRRAAGYGVLAVPRIARRLAQRAPA